MFSFLNDKPIITNSTTATIIIDSMIGYAGFYQSSLKLGYGLSEIDSGAD